jgi:hypothetical protein
MSTTGAMTEVYLLPDSQALIYANWLTLTHCFKQGADNWRELWSEQLLSTGMT